MSPSASCQQSTQALEYLFKFIVQSRILYSRATCGMEEDQFRASIQDLFQSIRFVLSLDSRSSENLVFTQVRRSRNPVCLMTHRLIYFLPPLFMLFFCMPDSFIDFLLFISLLNSILAVHFRALPTRLSHPRLVVGQFWGVISRMPVCGHALRLSPISVSHSAPLCLFYGAARAWGPHDEVI